MWTERAEIISDFNEAISYIEFQDCFHDYRLGNIELFDSKIIIMIEEEKKMHTFGIFLFLKFQN